MQGPVLGVLDNKVDFGPYDLYQYPDKIGYVVHRTLSPENAGCTHWNGTDQKCFRNSDRELGEMELKQGLENG